MANSSPSGPPSHFKPSKACCGQPPKSHEYEPQGRWETIGTTKYYITGNSNATHALLLLYDIFGYYPQTLQGADILSNQGSKEFKRQCVVIIPDLFDGKYAEYEWYPPDTAEKEEKLEAFINGPGEATKTVAHLLQCKQDMQQEFPCVRSWGLVGYCWGGYVASQIPFLVKQHKHLQDAVEAASRSAQTSKRPFSNMVLLHSGFVKDPEVAKAVDVPVLCLLSKDETEEEVAPFRDNLAAGGSHEIITFGEMQHGWMSARADLKDEKGRNGYDEGYATVQKWLDGDVWG